MRRSARLPNDSEDDGVISLRACKKFRRCKTRLGCSGVSCSPGSEGGDDSSLGTLLFNGCCSDEIAVGDETLLSMASSGVVDSGSVDCKFSSFGRFSSNCRCEETITERVDSPLMAGIGVMNVSDEDDDGEESLEMAATGVFGDSDRGLGARGSDFQGRSTCSLTESKAADTHRSEIQ